MLTAHVVYLEIAHDFPADSFILAQRQVIFCYGPIGITQFNDGTNFVSGEKDLKNPLKDLYQTLLKMN